MVERQFYDNLILRTMAGDSITNADAETILISSEIDLMDLIYAAYQVRRHYFHNTITVHILNNVQNGRCPEDCSYCAQSRDATAPIVEYPMKSDEEILEEARLAYEGGAYRYCMVFSGRGPGLNRIKHLASLIKEIKRRYPIEVCVSPGLVDETGIRILKEAGLDRLNHNLNTSAENYPKICTTHSYNDRIATLQNAKQAGLAVCSGVIIGMGETIEEIIEMAQTLRKFRAESIPVNFFIPIPGTPLKPLQTLTPEYCLRVLCLFRFINPDSEIRVAAGREWHLKSLEVLSLYPANSLFVDGYLNAKGSSRIKTLKMIQEAGFKIISERSLEELLAVEKDVVLQDTANAGGLLKTPKELHPAAPQKQT